VTAFLALLAFLGFLVAVAAVLAFAGTISCLRRRPDMVIRHRFRW